MGSQFLENLFGLLRKFLTQSAEVVEEAAAEVDLARVGDTVVGLVDKVAVLVAVEGNE